MIEWASLGFSITAACVAAVALRQKQIVPDTKRSEDRILRIEERMSSTDLLIQKLRERMEIAVTQTAGAVDMLARLALIEANVEKLAALVRYEMQGQLADDAVAYAEQQARNQPAAAWTSRDKADAALDYARVQAAKLKIEIDADAMRLAIEARVGKMNAP